MFNPIKMKTNFIKAFKNVSQVFCLVMAFIFVSNNSGAQVCSSPSTTIYSLSNAGGIYPITISNANVGTIVNTTSYGSSTSANSIGYNTANGLFYYFQVALSGAKTFVSYNPTTKVYKTLNSSSIAATVNRGCVSYDGTGYYCLDVNSNLYYYNIAADSWTLICSTFKDQSNNNVTTTFTSESSGDMAIDGYGNLYVVCSSGAQYGLYELPAPLPTTSTASITMTRLIASTTATPAGIGFTGIAFDPTGNIYMATSTDLYVLKNGFALSHIAAFSVANVNGDLTSCSYPFSVLPVLWQNFTATEQKNETVSVAWEVSQQINDKGYYVERSADGINWNQLGFVASSGNSEGTAQYFFTDESPASGKNYYRISEVDMDGKENYSEIRTANIDNNSATTVSVWPNPATDVIHVQTNNETYSIARIYNQSGALIGETKIQAGVNTINVSNLSFGVYIINIKAADGQSYNKKFIKQ
jgi:hypothetical protein